MALRSSSELSAQLRARGLLVALSPGVVVLLLSALNPGTTDAQRPIWDAVDQATRDWYATGPPASRVLDSDLPSAISFVGSTVQVGLDVVNYAYIESGTWPGWVITAAAMVALVTLILLMCDLSAPGIRATAAGTTVICVSAAPLFVVGFDWGRWVALICSMTAVVGLHRVLQATEVRPLTPTLVSAGSLALGLIAAAAIGLPEVGDPPVMRWLGQ